MASYLATSTTGQIAFHEAVNRAEMRSYHTYFNTHVVEENDGSFQVIQDTSYDTIPMHIIDRITYTAQGRMAEDY